MKSLSLDLDSPYVQMPKVAVIGDNEVYTSKRRKYHGGFLGQIAPVTISTLLNGLVAYWPANNLDGIDIISGNIVNVIGGNAESQPGKIGNCWSALAGGAIIQEVTDTINISFPNSFTLHCWTRYTIAPTGFTKILAKFTAGGGYQVSQSAGTYNFIVQNAVSDFTLIGPSIDADSIWHRLVFYHDKDRNVVGSIKDSNAAIENNLGAFVYAPPTDSADFTLAELRFSVTANQIDEIGMWNRALTSSELLTLWNGGAGKTYPF